MAYNRNNTPNRPTTNSKKAETVRWFTSLDGTQLRVFVREFDGRLTASTSVGVKSEDGDFDNCYISVDFVREAPSAAGMYEILLKKGFWSAYYSKNHSIMLPKIVIMEYEEV